MAWRRTQPYAVVNIALVNIVFGGAPSGAANRMKGVPKRVAGHTTRTKTVGLSARDSPALSE
eukprot:7183079-Pyramimonas_sp.AAC.1